MSRGAGWLLLHQPQAGPMAGWPSVLAMSCRVRSRGASSSGATATLKADARSATCIPKGQNRNQKTPKDRKPSGSTRPVGAENSTNSFPRGRLCQRRNLARERMIEMLNELLRRGHLRRRMPVDLDIPSRLPAQGGCLRIALLVLLFLLLWNWLMFSF